MGFHSLNASILKKSYALSPSTKETRSTPQWSPIRLPESFWNLKMKKFDPHLYRQLIGSLMQLATSTRPDIAYSVSDLSQFFPNPARRHWTLARRVVNYLKTTQDSVLFLSSEQGGPVTDSPMLKANCGEGAEAEEGTGSRCREGCAICQVSRADSSWVTIARRTGEKSAFGSFPFSI